ncbi:glycosyl hydrolase family 4 [Orenia metallireducens]|uniref:Glycosyl hydrolase family 4 n=1 Tax=Orenia metallireducens TaxID=1413210 RepID=A0A1C0A8J2_9FIRM|nr:glycosyl hydrolase family 4 [Orenia metallireducens]OCL26540.1 glycosyl hydrolase family 4 [Orenia metallireducens]
MGIKLTVIGGSGLYTPLLFDAIANYQEEIDFDEICLNGRTASKLEKVARLSQSVIDRSEYDFKVTYTTDRQKALQGAEMVLSQIRVGGMKARAYDEEFPLKYDIIGEETVGPGGFANALRTVPVMLELAREMEEYCPEALLINLTNPASIVQQAIEQETTVNVISLCDLPVGVLNKIAKMLDVDRAEIRYEYFGLNHLGWYQQLAVKGENRTSEVIKKVDSLGLGIDSDWIENLEIIPLPYLKYYYHHAKEVEQAKEKDILRAEELIETSNEIAKALEESPETIPELIYQRGAIWYSDVIVPLIATMVNDKNEEFILNIANNGLIAGIDDEVIVEVATIVNGSGIRALEVGDIPLQVKSLLQQEANYRNLATQAAISQDKDDILRALVANPQVPSYEVAYQIWKEEFSK